MNRGTRVFAAAAMSVVLLAGCSGGGGGGGGSVSAQDFASKVCSSLSDWLDAIRQRASEVGGAVKPGTSPQEGQDILRDYMDGVINDTKDMVEGVRDAGVPDVPNGETIENTLVTALEGAEQAFETAREQVDSLPTDSADAFKQGAETLASSINSHASDVTRALQGVSSAQLDEAFSNSEACQSAGGS